MPAPLDLSTCELVWNRWDQARVWVTAVLEALHPADVSLSLFKKPSTEVNPKLPASVVVAFCTVPPVMAVQQCFGWHIRVNIHIYQGLIPCSLLYLTGSASLQRIY